LPDQGLFSFANIRLYFEINNLTKKNINILM
jgi:hypothetical protein